MMNVPGILNGNPEACSKVAAALNLDKPVDGHAPLCTGADLEAYARAGIRTDHECTTSSKLRERISPGMYLSIREGSLARNLLPLIENLTADLSRRCSFCTPPTRSSAVTSTACWRWPSRRASVPLTP